MQQAKKIKIQIKEKDKDALEFMQSKCRGLYNWWIAKLKSGESWRVYEAKKTLQASKEYDPEINQVYGKLLAEVYFRIDKAMKVFFRRCKQGEEKKGFPRFKARHQFFTLLYPAMYIKIKGNKIILPTGGKGKNKKFCNVVATLTENPPENFGEVAVSRDARGSYYCSFVYETEKSEPKEKPGILAVDLGIKTLACCVNEKKRFYHVGGFKGYSWYNKQLDKIRSKRDKCKKKSRRYLYLSQVYQRVSQKKRNKRNDSLHKASHLISHKLAESAVVIGDLSQRQMVEKSNNKYKNRTVFNEWGLYLFVQMLSYKLFSLGKQLFKISERDTSKECHQCHNTQSMPLHKRTYKCPHCGMAMDRDENSALNILERFLARLGPYACTTACDVLG